jgi:O-antigen/teichoic acid export membrane protein
MSAAGALVGVVVATVLGLMLIPQFGIEGAALAHVIGTTLAVCWLAWWTRRATHIRTSALVARWTP